MKKQSFFCPLPWVHLSLEPGGKVYSCCNTSFHKELGNINNNSFEEILNSTSNETMREKFSNREIPKECSICVDQETLGQISLRESSIRKFPSIDSTSKPSLKYLSLRLDNICNLKCRTCGPELSTSWYKDSLQMGDNIPAGVIQSFKDESSFEDFINTIPQTLEVLYFAGGEPFLSPKFYRVLEKLLENNQSNVEILINTNITKVKLNDKDGLKILSSFKNVYLDLSIDGIEEVGDYSRKGMKWIETKRLIEEIQELYPSIKMKIFPTISILNIFHIPDLFAYFLDNNILTPSDIRINTLTLPEYLCISNLPAREKEIVKKQIRNYSKELLTKFDFDCLTSLLTQLNGIIQQVSIESNDEHFKTFLSITTQLDKIRNEDIKEVIPELKPFFT
ncbi:twitch domain-containing radical SAM protein [Halobacteriovorax sp.]|uniref:twitch domain-containing radical SAM protein n=1 Tax=Halobacteriovorax sp. TaxID=2020862 RepID=UPI003562D6BA